jgi:hypothetical protein
MAHFIYHWLFPQLFVAAIVLAQPIGAQIKPLIRDVDTLRSYLQRTGTIGGRISIFSSHRIPRNLVVTIRDTSNLARSLNVDSTGRYVFGLIPPGSYLLWAKAPGFETQYQFLEVSPGRSSTNDIGLIPDYTVPSTHKTGGVVGIVLDSVSSISIPYAAVALVTTNRTIAVDIGGHFAIYDLKPGHYTFHISASGHKTISVDSVLVEAGNATSLRVFLPRAAYTLPRY